MPYTWEKTKKKIPPELDRRRKIQVSEHEYIRKRYKAGESLRGLGRAYGVDKRLIQFILYPERLEHIRKIQREQKYSQNYYKKVTRGNKWRKTMREHRRYKQSIKNKLI